MKNFNFFSEIKKDFILLYEKINNCIIIFNNYTLLKKLWLLLLWLLTILPLYLLFYLLFYFFKYFFKYLFYILDYYINILFFKYYNKFFFINIYFYSYLLIRNIIIIFFYKSPIIIKKLIKIIKNYFYIKYYIIFYFYKLKNKIDKKLYNIYLKIEYILSFSYIEKFKFELNYKYIPKYKKYKKYSKQYLKNKIDKTIKIRKKIYLYYIYLNFIKRKIFWLYIKEIYLDLVWTTIKSFLYYFFILMPLYLYINIKYKMIKKYTQFILNKKELIKPLKIIYLNIFIFFCIFNFFNLNLILIIFIIIPFHIIFQFIYILTISSIIYNWKIKIYGWYYFYKILDYEDLKLRCDIEYQIYTLFLFVYMHAFHDLRIHWFIIYILYKGNNKYYYFNKFYYKLYFYLFYIFLKSKI